MNHLRQKMVSVLSPPLLSQSNKQRRVVPLLSRATIGKKLVAQKMDAIQVKRFAEPENTDPKLLKLAENVIVPS